ncbi:MAG: arginine--tRNA ligase [Bacilli bacterium]|nr:arginine--tRNA ligase [Bacilli bacterium]
MSLIKETEKYITKVIKEFGFEIDNVVLEPSSRRDLGEAQINVCMSLAKKYGKNPRELANLIVSKFDDRFTNVNIAGPGFINVSFNEKYLLPYLNKSINDFDRLVDKQEEKTIIVDYGGANAAKALHVGHMRTANIGEALKRLARILGNKVIGDVHLGDLGRQSGMVISEIKKRKPNLCYFDPDYKGEYPKLEITKEELAEYYPTASKDAKENPERMEEVRQITAWVDEGKEPYISMWKDIVEVSCEVIKKTYDYLNCDFDLWEGELSSLKYIKPTLKILEPYMYESEGAKVIDVKKEDDKVDIPPLIVIKNDGASIYATRDLATIYNRITTYNPDEIWYVVDVRQGLYFEQVFRASYKSELVRPDVKLAHYWNGTMNGKDGKPFKTRDGGVLELNDLLSQVREELSKKLNKYESEEEKNNILDILTVATVKYADLLPFRTTDYIFDIEKFCSFEGKTGPYILYTMVRIKSILNKANVNTCEIKSIYGDTEKDIYIKILELSRILDKAYSEKTLSYICEYLFELCSLFNKFYSECNILNENDIDKKSTYIALLKLLYNTCEKLLDVLAIRIPKKM